MVFGALMVNVYLKTNKQTKKRKQEKVPWWVKPKASGRQSFARLTVCFEKCSQPQPWHWEVWNTITDFLSSISLDFLESNLKYRFPCVTEELNFGWALLMTNRYRVALRSGRNWQSVWEVWGVSALEMPFMGMVNKHKDVCHLVPLIVWF